MQTLQKTVAAIRALECEEIDLVAGGVSLGTESTRSPTMSTFSYNSNGHIGTVTTVDDMYEDAYVFAYD